MRTLLTPVAPFRFRHRSTTSTKSSQLVWLFDLDNTLHDASKAIFKAINNAMTAAVATSLNVDDETASHLRATYWKRYGATVIGLVRHHGVDAKTFLDLCHDFDIPSMVHSETGLADKLNQLPGRKILLTNAPLNYARLVLKTLGILQQFEGLWAIDHMQLQGKIKPKPSLALMRQVLARVGVPASRVILVEDTLQNLRPAKQLGMRTVHIFHPDTPHSKTHRGRNMHVDLRINKIGHLLTGQYGLKGLTAFPQSNRQSH